MLIAVAVVVALVAVVAGGYLFNLAHTFDSGTSKIEQAFPDESTRPKKTNTVDEYPGDGQRQPRRHRG